MNISSTELGDLTDKFPGNEKPVQTLFEFLKSSNQNIDVTINRIYDLIAPSSFNVLNAILSEFVSRGILKRVVRVKSRVHDGGIGDYNSISELPDEITDVRDLSGQSFKITNEDIEIVYKFSSYG